jgi:class 3 adenylate cyclase
MRLTIGLKIFGILVILLLLMAAVAVISTVSIDRVSDEMLVLAQYYIPLMQHVGHIRKHTLHQLINYEQMSQSYAREPRDDGEIERTKSLFEQRGEAVDRSVEEGLRLIGEALGHSDFEVDRLTLAALQPALSTLEREHQQFHDHVLRVLREWEQGNVDRAEMLEEILVREKEDIDREAERIQADVDRLVLDAAVRVEAHERRVLRLNWILTLGAILIGLSAAAILTRGLVRPVQTLVEGARQVETGNLDARIEVRSRDEIGRLAEAFNHMVAELRIKDRIKATFGKYVDPRIVEHLIEDPEFSASGADRRVVTVSFADLEKFTSISEGLTAQGLVKLLNRYFEEMSGPIRDNSGIIDKYIGDAIMAFWGPPFTREREHARLACFAALEQQEKVGRFQEALPELMGVRMGLPSIGVRIGIATGEVVVGNIGSEFSRGFTVIGDTVNLGARLESANRHYGSRILLCERTFEMAGESVLARELDRIRVAGKSEPVQVYELLGRGKASDSILREVKVRFESGLNAYRNRDWRTARRAFEDCIRARGEDPPSRVFLARLQTLETSPPPEDWDAVWEFSEK